MQVECYYLSVFTLIPFLYQAKQSVTGRIVEILAESEGKRAVVVLDIFEVRSTRHEIFGMPMLAQRHEETIYAVIPSTVCISPWSLYLIIRSK